MVLCCFAEDIVKIVVLLPMTGSSRGRRIAGAVAVAVDAVNADRDLLQGQKLEFDWGDSGCSPGKSLEAIGALAEQHTEEQVDWAAVIGPSCSSACEVTHLLLKGPNLLIETQNVESGDRLVWKGWGLPQISHGCTSPTLSDDQQYPLFSRTVAPETQKGPTLISLMRHYNWQVTPKPLHSCFFCWRRA